ncbi:MAG: AMP-binding protein [bacterium]
MEKEAKLERLLDLIAASTRAHPEYAAVTLNNQSYSYEMVFDAADRLRGSLAEIGIRQGDRVGILLPNSPHFPIAYYAILGLGAIAVPLNIMLKARELAYQLEDSEARAIIAWGNFAQEVEKAAAFLETLAFRIYLGDNMPPGSLALLDLIRQGNRLPPSDEVSPQETAVILYTAGVTGRPKGAELTHHNLAYHATELRNRLRMTPKDRLLAVLPFYHALGQGMLMNLAFVSSAELVIHSRFHPGDVLRALQEEQITCFLGVPTMYSLISGFPSAPKYETGLLRYCICGGAKLSQPLALQFEEQCGHILMEGYGLSETSSMVCLNTMADTGFTGSVGSAIRGIDLRIVSENDEELPVGNVGEILIRGETVMQGYRGRPDLSAQALRGGWLHTGDLGKIDIEGNLYLVDRKDDMILKSGFKIYPREIEEVLEQLPHIQEVAVVGVSDPVVGEEIKACIILKDGADLSSGDIIEYCRERIAAYKCPRMIRFYKEFPRAPGGKILKSELRNR